MRDKTGTEYTHDIFLDASDRTYLSAHNVIAAVLKRLAHRNPNVQLYALSLAEALSKNCTIELHREIASRAFTQGLEKIITDRVCP
jgi:signal transducing adaptor molecule